MLMSLSSAIGHSPMHQQAQTRLATMVIVVVLGLQSVAILLRSNAWIWPFTDYPMYAWSHHEGERVSARHYIYATTADGEEIEILPEDVGVNIFLFERWGRHLMENPSIEVDTSGQVKNWLKSTTLFRLLKGEDGTDMTELFVTMAERNLGKDIVKLRVEDTSYVVTRNGHAPATPHVVSIDLDSENE
jgi:hypothetical protein